MSNGDAEIVRWKIRRRFAIASFIHLLTIPIWGGQAVSGMELPAEVLTGLLWADVAIIGAYIGGVVIDDNWKK